MAPTSLNLKRKGDPKKPRSSAIDAATDDDQVESLFEGFESSDDDVKSPVKGYKPGTKLPPVPDHKRIPTILKNVKPSDTDEPGVVYVGRIPHGFYEAEMRAYFSQFGIITRLRLSRNRKTGRSKHYAFIEFASSDVAQVVADTMNNYLMFGHILKCQIVPKGQVHDNLWKGANKKFRTVPWNVLERKQLGEGKTREDWERKAEREKTARKMKKAQLKKIGYEFDMPILRSAKPAKSASPRHRKSHSNGEPVKPEESSRKSRSTTTITREEPNTVVVNEEATTFTFESSQISEDNTKVKSTKSQSDET
ncbi:MAG: hypothetical protein M1833_005325 [Piccolia ochrophora]|nr:MAG: hypothetical protein M1833_005325 [Piccolia ochrophora]